MKEQTKGERIVAIAFAEVGTKEEPANSNLQKYGKWFGFNGVAWCAMFVSWCYAKAGTPLPAIGYKKGYAGCQTAVKYFREQGLVTTEPKLGALVFFDWNKDGRFDHTGIFNGWKNKAKGEFYTIEGNTSSTNQSNGGEVQSRVRSTKQSIFVNPLELID